MAAPEPPGPRATSLASYDGGSEGCDYANLKLIRRGISARCCYSAPEELTTGASTMLYVAAPSLRHLQASGMKELPADAPGCNARIEQPSPHRRLSRSPGPGRRALPAYSSCRVPLLRS